MNVTKRDGSSEPYQIEKIHKMTKWATDGLNVSQSQLELETGMLVFDGMKTSDFHDAMIHAASGMISVECQDATFTAARLLLQKLYKEVAGSTEYPRLGAYIAVAIGHGLVTPDMLSFDLNRLNDAIKPERDLQFTYVGLQTVVDRYLLRANVGAGKAGNIIELPQHFFMRVAMGLAQRESNKTERAIEFYELLSSFDFMSSTPTLFNSGTLHQQLSSCYLNQAADTISAGPGEHKYASIFGVVEECANLSKYAGGIGTDWTPVRGAGDLIKGTNGKSSGVVPYLKLFNDTAVAVNQGGKRNGAFAAYLEPWHPDFYDFCDLKKNVGEERRRAHDIYPAVWAPDLFFKRVEEEGVWSFFSPADFPELHELYGDAFEARYVELERQGKFRFQKPAVEVWRKWLTSLFETGHPWVTFKDECNRRNPQDHVGVIHSSNLCTEITLNTSSTETAVCNLGSINLSHIKGDDQLKAVIKTAVRMLDNVIDINFYPSDRAEASNMKHRPIGLGVMGYTEYLVQRGIDWESFEHLAEVNKLFEKISFFAIDASCELAKERGAYASFDGSKWSRGILPIDTARNPIATTMDWAGLREKIRTYGMRNSNVMAIAPTATISNIVGTTATIEPVFEREVTKSNLSGSFVVVDPALRHGRPELCKEAFEIDPTWIIRAAAVRQKWLDQAQSVNIFVKAGVYMNAWKLGLKTTYYLRSQSAEVKGQPAGPQPIAEVKQCAIDNPDCESCQ